VNRLTRKLGVFLLALSVLSVPAARAASVAATPGIVDLGSLESLSAKVPISVTVALHLSNLDEAQTLLTSLYTVGDPQYHQFLSAEQFVARFAPSDADVAKVEASLANFGLSAERTTATTLRVTGLPADLERAFAVSLHSYEVPAHDTVAGFTFHAPLSVATVPADIVSLVSAVAGLDSRPRYHAHARAVPTSANKSLEPLRGQATGDAPGSYTVTDFANYYNVNPLYQRGVSGSGTKLAILTLANFTPSDAFNYWQALGLKVNSNRLTVINVDGGPGTPSDASGSLETTLDVEQSGGIAPGAEISVYMAPNTNQGFVDVFAIAVDSNWAATLSISWGEWEWLENLENSPVTDPITGNTVATTQAVHELLLRAAIQGQSMYTASGDGGAYEAYDDGLGPPDYSIPLSAEYPASDTYMTAGGGTTLASTQSFTITGQKKPLVIVIPHERVWGWDWLDPLCDALGTPNPISCGTFSGGSGGGVSVTFGVPSYQRGLPGVQLSQPKQAFIEYLPAPTQLLYALPAYYAGRNVPDVSFDADPYTGYVVYYTSSVTGYGLQSGWGGTSFVAPQLNGVTALFNQYLGERVGLLNFPLYNLAHTGNAYGGRNPPLNAIVYGDNWFYDGSNGYNPAVGLGTMNVANFAAALRANAR
jgi:kumamolisin